MDALTAIWAMVEARDHRYMHRHTSSLTYSRWPQITLLERNDLIRTTIQEGTLSLDAVTARVFKVDSTVSCKEVSAVIEVADGIARVAGPRSAKAVVVVSPVPLRATAYSVCFRPLMKLQSVRVLSGEVSEI